MLSESASKFTADDCITLLHIPSTHFSIYTNWNIIQHLWLIRHRIWKLTLPHIMSTSFIKQKYLKITSFWFMPGNTQWSETNLVPTFVWEIDLWCPQYVLGSSQIIPKQILRSPAEPQRRQLHQQVHLENNPHATRCSVCSWYINRLWI